MRLHVGVSALLGVVLLTFGCRRESTDPAPVPEPPPAPVPTGVVTGHVEYLGDARPYRLKITKDTSTCGADHDDDDLRVLDGRLANAIVAIEGLEGEPPGDATMTVSGCDFAPRVSIVGKGMEVHTRMDDPVLHNPHWLQLRPNGRRKSISGSAMPHFGKTYSRRIRRPGLVDVRCDAHEWMQAWIWVTPHPYVTLTDARGRFRIGGVPAGTHPVVIWHERFGRFETTVTVDPDKPVVLTHRFEKTGRPYE